LDYARDGLGRNADNQYPVKILALELSSAKGGLAWLEDDREFSRDWPNDRKDSGPFFENLQETIARFGLPDRIIVGLGPGSYAGVRIAISAAIGLQASSGAELLGYPSICAMETGADDYCVVGDARRQSFYFARVRMREVVDGFELENAEELKARLDKLESDVPIMSSDSLSQFGSIQSVFPSALILAQLAAMPNRRFSRMPLEPIYLREPHITMPKSGINLVKKT